MWVEIILIVILIILLLLFSIHAYIHSNDSYWPDRGVDFVDITKLIPWYKRFNVRGSTPKLDQEIYDRLKNKKYGGYMELRSPTFYVKDLDLLRQILVKDFHHFGERRNFDASSTDKYLSRMMAQMRGQEWKDMRAIISPTFSTGKIRRMFSFFNLSGQNLSNYLKTKLGDEESSIIEFQDCFGRYAMDVISSVAFGLNSDTFEVENSMFRMMAIKFSSFSLPRILKIVAIMMFPYVAKLLDLQILDTVSSKFFTSIAWKAIQSRKMEGVAVGEGKGKRKASRNDFLQLLLEAQAGLLKEDGEVEDEDGGSGHQSSSTTTTRTKEVCAAVLDDKTVISQCLMFFAAGLDAVEVLLTFAAYELAINPDIQDKLVQEVRQTLEDSGDGDGDLTYEMIQKMQYLDMVISETLRLHPPSFRTDRNCTEEYRVPGTNIVIPKNSITVIPIMSIQRDETYYPQPEKFNPEHFTTENKAKRHPYAFLPFSHGPRSCIAMRFALTEAKAAIVNVVRNFRIEPCEKTQIPVKFDTSSFIVRPEKEMFLKFSNR